jgi:nitroreductase
MAMTRPDLTFDEILTTTRAVRKRLDVTRKVPRALLEECLELAFQAPNGSNKNLWRWIIVDDPEMVAKLGAEYRTAMGVLQSGQQTSMFSDTSDSREEAKLLDSAYALADKIERMPALLIPLMPGRVEGKSVVEQAAMWGSIVQAVWSFMLALRSRGLGSCWATVTSRREKEIAALLGIPYEEYTQVGMFPIAYTIGTDFKKAWRKPVAEVLSYNRF